MKKHQEIARVEPDWARIRALMDEDKKAYASEDFLLALPNERAQSRADREKAFIVGFTNPTTAIIRAKGDSVYKKEITRNNLTSSQEEFVKRCDRSKQPFAEVMQSEVSPTLSAFGTVFAVVDKPAKSPTDKEDELKNALPYLTILDPAQAVDFEWSDDGELLWFAYYIDSPVDKSTPLKPKKKWRQDKGVAVWTKTEFYVKGKDGETNLQAPIPNPFGFVPVVIQAQYVDPNKTIGKSTFFSSSQYIIMANNLSAAANQEVFKNASAILTMNVQDFGDDHAGAAIQHEKNPDTNLRRMTKQADEIKNILLYQDKGDKPEYLARDLELIKLAEGRAEKYFEMVIENEKSGLSPETLKKTESGVSKGYDFKDVNNTLCGFGNALNHFENQTLRMVAKMSGEAEDGFSVKYPDDYDTREFIDRVNAIKGLREIEYPSKTGMDEAYKTLTPEITKSQKLRTKIDGEIEKAQPQPISPTSTNQPNLNPSKP